MTRLITSKMTVADIIQRITKTVKRLDDKS